MLWRKSFRWYDIVVALLPVLITLWQFVVRWASESHQSGNSGASVGWILYLQYPVPIVLGVAFICLYLFKLKKEAIPKQIMTDYLNVLHKTYFPSKPGAPIPAPSPKHRITLFVPKSTLFAPIRWPRWRGKVPYPSRDKHLVLYTRSGGLYPKSKVSWNISKSSNRKYEDTASGFDGVAGCAFANRDLLPIPRVDESELPDYNSATEDKKKEYLKRTHIGKEKVEKLNVTWRSYQALPIQNKSGQYVGLLMMESEEPRGLAIFKEGKWQETVTEEKWGEIAATIQCLFIS